MALIKCSECSASISDKALACPKCGAPIVSERQVLIAKARQSLATGAQITTVQETSKKFKLQSLLSVTLIIISLALFMSSKQEPSAVSGLLFIVGIVWYVVNRFRIWWHHK